MKKLSQSTSENISAHRSSVILPFYATNVMKNAIKRLCYIKNGVRYKLSNINMFLSSKPKSNIFHCDKCWANNVIYMKNKRNECPIREVNECFKIRQYAINSKMNPKFRYKNFAVKEQQCVDLNRDRSVLSHQNVNVEHSKLNSRSASVRRSSKNLIPCVDRMASNSLLHSKNVSNDIRLNRSSYHTAIHCQQALSAKPVSKTSSPSRIPKTTPFTLKFMKKNSSLTHIQRQCNCSDYKAEITEKEMSHRETFPNCCSNNTRRICGFVKPRQRKMQYVEKIDHEEHQAIQFGDLTCHQLSHAIISTPYTDDLSELYKLCQTKTR